MWPLYATLYCGRSNVGGKGARICVEALAKGVSIEYLSVATYCAVGRDSPSTDDEIYIIRTRDIVSLTYPVFTWALQCESWPASTTVRHGTRYRGSRH